jgi:hypothetical protein
MSTIYDNAVVLLGVIDAVKPSVDEAQVAATIIKGPGRHMIAQLLEHTA